jgi:hypothetical protein
MTRGWAVLVLALACRPASSEAPDHDEADRDARVVAEAQPTPVAVPPVRCTVRVGLQERVLRGEYATVSIEVDATLPDPGQAPPPTLIVGHTHPNGQRIEQALPMVGEQVCAYCLPTAGSSGCDHDCRYEPYLGGQFSIGPLYDVGVHRIDVAMQHSNCVAAFEVDGEDTIEVVAQ